MKIAGANDVAHPPQVVWDALLDPRVLLAAIPGCSRLVETGEHAYAMTVTAGVAAIKGTYDGTCALSDLAPHDSLVMRLSGSGAPGTIDAEVAVRFSETPEGTRVSYDADATVGGMVGGVGQRMLASVSRRMAAEFFGNVAAAIETPPGSAAAADPAAPVTPVVETAPGVYTAPAAVAQSAAGSRTDFLSGVAVGAGLVTLGVVLGRWLGRP